MRKGRKERAEWSPPPAEGRASGRLMGGMPALHETKVLDWRNDMFSDMGFDDVMAGLLAHSSVDTHMMRSLLLNGCPHETAVRILLGTDYQGDDPDFVEG